MGCLGCLGISFLVLAILFLVPYLLIFHSPLPVKWLAGEVAENSNLDGSSIDLSGVGGSISKGVTVKEVVVYGAEGDSTIEGFKFHFNGLVDSIRNKRLIIDELSTERAEFVVGAGFFKDMVDDEEEGEDEEKENEGAESGSESEEGSEDFHFELRELRFSNSHFRSPDGELDIKIPLIRLTGLSIVGDEFGLDEFEIDSDHIQVELSDASPETIEGVRVPFTKKISGSVSPGLHPLVKSEIDFSFEFAALDSEASSRIFVFGGAMEQTLLPDGVSRVRFAGLSLGDFFHSEDLVLPEKLTFKALQKGNRVAIDAGEFFLGQTRFETPQQEVNEDDPDAAIIGHADVGEHKVEALIRPEEGQIWPPFVVELSATSDLKPRELLAQVYFQRALEVLTVEEKARIDALHTSQTEILK